MDSNDLESRVAALEAEVGRLKGVIPGASGPGGSSWLESIAGKYANDPIHEEAMRLGREYRESLRPKPRTRRKV